MGMRDAAASPNAWLGFVTTQLKEHDNSWPKSLDSDDGLSESEKASRDRLRAKWQSQRDLYAQDVKLAAEAVGLAVDVRGYPMLPEPVKEEPRNGFLSPEDAARLHGMLSPGQSPFGMPAQPYAEGAMEVTAQLLAPVLDGLRERMEREREQSRSLRDGDELRFKVVLPLVPLSDVDAMPFYMMMALDFDGRVWCSTVKTSQTRATFFRLRAYAEKGDPQD